MLLLLAMTVSLAARRWPYFPGDVWLARRIQDLPLSATGWLTTFMNGEFPTIAIAAGSLAALFLIARRERAMGLLIAASLLVRIASPVLKDLSARPRPDPALVEVTDHVTDPGFPSGHSLGAFALFAVLVLLVGDVPVPRLAREAMRAAIGAGVLLVGLCRVLSGAHWPSDVIGGYLWAAVLVLPMIALYEWSRAGRSPTT